MAPVSAKCSTDVLKHVCKLMKQPTPKYTYTPIDGGCLSHVKVMNSKFAGEVGGSLAESRASAARNALKKILGEDKSDLKKDDLVQEYLARFKDNEVVQVREPSVLCTKYAEALTSMRDVKVGVLLKAMRKTRNRAECEKFLSMGVEDRYKWLESLGC